MSEETIKRSKRAFEFLLSEAGGTRSRSTVTIARGSGKLAPGTVLGRIAKSGKYTASPAAEQADIAGAETGLAVLCYGVDATDKDIEVAAITGHAEVKSWALTYDSSVDGKTKVNAKLDHLQAVGIIAR